MGYNKITNNNKNKINTWMICGCLWKKVFSKKYDELIKIVWYLMIF